MKKQDFLFLLRNLSTLFTMAAFVMMTVSCSDSDDPVTPTPEPDPDPEPTVVVNPASYITDASKLEMLYSMKDLDGTGRLYEINYTADYKLNEVLGEMSTSSIKDLQTVMFSKLFDVTTPKTRNLSFGAGCSAFAVPAASGDHYIMGRNFDFKHVIDTTYVPISAIVVHTAPAGGKKSVSVVDSYYMGYTRGFYNDSVSDLSYLMALPYLTLDGINEDGFAIGVLALDGKPTLQQEAGRRGSIGVSAAMRMLLDKVSTVDEAIEMLKEYNMDMRVYDTGSFHYFMADAQGGYATVEYVYPEGSDVPSVMEAITGNDTLRYVTNFYVSPTMAETEHGRQKSTHGLNRYLTLRKLLAENEYRLTDTQAVAVLDSVSQPPTAARTSQTQWSAVYNLNKKSLNLSVVRDYSNQYSFGVEAE